MKFRDFIIGHKIISAFIGVLLLGIISCAAFLGVTVHSLGKLNIVSVIPEYSTTEQAQTEATTQATTQAKKPKKKKSSGEMPDDLTEGEEDFGEYVHNLDNYKIWRSDDVINILLAGIDYGSKSFPYGRSDSMIIISVNKTARQINLVSLSRATYAQINGYAPTRLSHAHGYGDYPLMLQTIEQNYRIDIDNFVSVNFKDFITIIDLLGGCRVKLTEKEANALSKALARNGVENVGAGIYPLNGDLALEYSRLRKIDTDWNRTGRQRTVIMALLSRAKEMSMNELYAALNSIFPYITTDMTRPQIIEYMYAALAHYKDWEIKQSIIPHLTAPLTMEGGFEVLKLNWDSELNYLHNTLYRDVPDERITLS